jgi:hypothetical protein
MKKSDAQLQQDVLQELKYEPSINAAEIGVTAKWRAMKVRDRALRFQPSRGTSEAPLG